MWYAIRKKSTTRWTAYNLKEKPTLKRGYEMRGPFKTWIKAMIVVNNENTKP